MKGRTLLLALLVACGSAAVCQAAAAVALTTPPARYTIEADYTQSSPDGSVAIEQYVDKSTDDWTWQFWVRRPGAFTRLDSDPTGYPGHFIFTADLKWIIRVQKLGSGTATLHLYRQTAQGYVRATRKPVGDLAWDFMRTRRDWRKLVKAPEYHTSAMPAEGVDDGYRKLGFGWPANRYLLISLWGDADVRGRKPMQTGVVRGWRCRYDLQTGTFDVPAELATDNAKALVPE